MFGKLFWLIVIPLAITIIGGVTVEVIKIKHLSEAPKNIPTVQPAPEKPALAPPPPEPYRDTPQPPPRRYSKADYVGLVYTAKTNPKDEKQARTWRISVLPPDGTIRSAYIYIDSFFDRLFGTGDSKPMLLVELQVTGKWEDQDTFVGRGVAVPSRESRDYTPDDIRLVFSADRSSITLTSHDPIKNTTASGTLRVCKDVSTMTALDKCTK
jgi:hypothetical protein